MRDPNVERVRERLLQRSQAGIAKYGVTTAREDLTLREWITHALEETLDKAVYLERILQERLPGDEPMRTAPIAEGRRATPAQAARRRGGQRLDMRGERYGALTVVRLGAPSPSGAGRWLCRCDCGRECEVQRSNLRHPQRPKRDCGCGRGKVRPPAPKAAPLPPPEPDEEVPVGKVDLVYDLAARGVSADDIATRLHVTVDAVESLLTEDDEDAA